MVIQFSVFSSPAGKRQGNTQGRQLQKSLVSLHHPPYNTRAGRRMRRERSHNRPHPKKEAKMKMERMRTRKRMGTKMRLWKPC